MTPDHINGLLEVGGSIAIWFNVIALHLHKEVRGVSPVAIIFFFGWGLWNLFYYPHLDQWASFAGGVSVVVANAVWVGHMFWYRRRG